MPITNEPCVVQVGWYCWRCRGVVLSPCRSDCVAVYVDSEWAQEVSDDLLDLESE